MDNIVTPKITLLSNALSGTYPSHTCALMSMHRANRVGVYCRPWSRHQGVQESQKAQAGHRTERHGQEMP